MFDLNPNGKTVFAPVADDLKAKPGFNLVGYENDIRRIAEILTQSDADNVLLVGSAGVGRSQLILGIEQRRQQNDISLDIIKKHIERLDMPNLFLPGDNEKIEQKFREELEAFQAVGNVIAVVPDLFGFVQAIERKGVGSLLNTFMGSVRGSRMQMIAIVDSKQKAKLFEDHPELKSFFTVHEVNEPNAVQTLNSLRGMRGHYEAVHAVQITDDALQAVVDLSKKYKSVIDPNLAQPSNSFALLDRALSHFRVKHNSKPEALDKLESEIAALGYEKDALNNQVVDVNGRKDEIEARLKEIEPDHARQQAQWQAETAKVRALLKQQAVSAETVAKADREIAELQKQEDPANSEMIMQQQQLRALAAKQLKAINTQINDGHNKKLCFTKQDVVAAFSVIYKIDADQLNESERDKLLNMEDTLNKKVFDQPQAVKLVSDALKVARSGLGEEGKPEGSFIFSGPSGTGKTELAKGVAAVRTGDPENIVRIDMSEYMEAHSVARLIGPPPGYAGYENGGYLTEAIKRKPNAVILLDEIEKAHPKVMDVLLQVLDDGRLTDGLGQTVKFDQTLVIATTNIGSAHFLNKNLTFEQAEKKARDDLYAHYRPEFINRFTGVVGFKTLSVGALFKVAEREVNNLNKKLQAKGMTFFIPHEDMNAISEAVYDPGKNGRAMKAYFAAHVKPQLASFVLKASEDARKHPQIITLKFKSLEQEPTFTPSPDLKRPALVPLPGSPGLMTANAS